MSLLGNSIAMQAVSLVTFKYAVYDMSFGGTVTILVNGLSYDATTVPLVEEVVTLNNGDTIQMTYSRTSGIEISFIDYFLNNTYVTTYSGTTSFSTPVITTVGGNTYGFYYSALS